LRRRFPTNADLIEYPRYQICYTDDTQMAIGIAETLAAHGEILEERLCEAFVANYVPSRGYGRGARAVLDAMAEGLDYQAVAAGYFPGGSYGNGAAMRVAPIGLLFRDAPDRLAEQARLSALPTHQHPLGIEGAQLLAQAVALASHGGVVNRADFLAQLRQACTSAAFGTRLERAIALSSPDDLGLMGNGIEALESVVTAIASFAHAPSFYADTIANVILLGGDTDTMAAMAGALSGAFLGWQAIPPRLLDLLEDGGKGRTYLTELADRLLAVYEAGQGRR
jgi:poly(ADP-ribose) glycohydrolase ARH3